MTNDQILREIMNHVYKTFKDDPTGHDYFHMKRVAKMARQLAEREGADPFLSEVAGWVHDVGDQKLFKEPEAVVVHMNSFLKQLGLTESQIEQINSIVRSVSFSKGHRVPETLEGKVVQDADRLDAIGAIGIARTFAYGGAKGHGLHSEDGDANEPHTIQHFYEKLLLLKDLMNTSTGREIAEHRHRFMEQFLDRFYEEWDV